MSAGNLALMNATHRAALEELATWRQGGHPDAFPYDAVVAAFHGVGKHFVSRDLLEELDRVRRGVPRGCPAHRTLAAFLDTALDKFDGRYDNPSYLALEQLGLPGADGCPDPGHAAHRRDRLTALLMADVLRFELATLHGCIDLMPELRPNERIVGKRCRHALRAILPVLERLGIDVEVDPDDPMGTGHRVCRAVFADAGAEERRTVQLTGIPVSLVHDEYMFIRSLQAYETTLALIGVQLGAAVAALSRGDAATAAGQLRAAAAIMAESSPFWSLTATMQPEAFLRFREWTDGASAIQSRSYKRVESRCRRPDARAPRLPGLRVGPRGARGGHRRAAEHRPGPGHRDRVGAADPRGAHGGLRGHGRLRGRDHEVAQDPREHRDADARRAPRHGRQRGRGLPGGSSHDPAVRRELPLRLRPAERGRMPRPVAPAHPRLRRTMGPR